MKLLTRLMAGGGVAAFFFFSFVVMMLWNGIVAGHLGLGPTLSYLQVCGLWFLLIVVFAWTGIASTRVSRALQRLGWRARVPRTIGRIARAARSFDHDEDWDDIADRIKSRVKQGMADSLGEEPDVDWENIGERIEDRIKQRIRDWLDED